jgi:UDP-N-acetyl-D-mannosaminuronic acid dehydrogenase
MQKVVVVGGGGHVGLPLALVLADSGFEVISLDISEEVVEKINSGQLPFVELHAKELLIKYLANKQFKATKDFNVIQSADIIFFVVGTPVDEYLNPDPNLVVDTVVACKPHMNSNQLVILRSTVFPGVTKSVKNILGESNLFPDIAFCPERILEGHAIEEIKRLPQIVGTANALEAQRASAVFQQIGVETICVSLEEAELAKLFTNAWRYIKFATANQFWLMSNEAGLDFTKIREAVIYDYPRASDLPNAGFSAGPCLLKDTMQLAAFSNNNFALGHSAMLINEGLPLYLVEKLQQRYNLSHLNIGILGAAFKGESDDIRSSLAYKLKKILIFKSKSVLMSDPYVTVDQNLVPLENLIETSDILIVAAPHSVYRNIETSKPIVDIWNLLGKGNLI